MRVAIIASDRYNRAVAVQESNRAAADGCEVLTLPGAPDPVHDPAFDARVRLRHDDIESSQTRSRILARRWLVGAVPALLRRLYRRRLLRRPVGMARRFYNRLVVKPLERRFRAADHEAYTRSVADEVRSWEPDLVVLLNIDALALTESFLPWMEERRTMVAYAYAAPLPAA